MSRNKIPEPTTITGRKKTDKNRMKLANIETIKVTQEGKHKENIKKGNTETKTVTNRKTRARHLTYMLMQECP
jgi:hypothetical protein